MSITATAYGPFLASLGQAGVDFSSDDIWVALFTSSYTPDFDYNSDYYGLRNDYEVPDGGDSATLDVNTTYSWNGQQLKNVNWAYDTDKKAAVLSADNVTWTTMTGNFRYAIVYKWVPQSVDTVLIGALDYGTDQHINNSAFTIDFSNGVVTVAR